MPTIIRTTLVALLCASPLSAAPAQTVHAPDHQHSSAPDGVQLSLFGAGDGPTYRAGVYHLLDEAGSFGQSNAVALPRDAEGAFEALKLHGRMRIEEGGDGGAFLFLNTAQYGERGPAPYVADPVAPELRGSFAVGLDVHNPLNEEPFGEWGNYQGFPEREVSLHWDGREIVKRVADAEFRGDWVDVGIAIQHVPGGAEVSVRFGEAQVYDEFFVAEMLPYETRVAVVAGTRDDVATTFDVADLALDRGSAAAPRRRPLHVDVFNHVLTNNSKTSYEATVDLPPASWAFGRVLLTLDIHDAGKDWDEWDRNGHLYVIDDDGEKWDIVPFITSYRRECHWVVDVTPFRSLLSGSTRFEIVAGTTFYKNRGYMMSVTLDYYHGQPMVGGEVLEPYAVVPLWHTTAHYRSEENHFADAYQEREVLIPVETEAAFIRTTTTGHSQIGEFTPSERSVEFVADVIVDDGDEPVAFTNTLWKTDCYLNPIRPQFGTWKYSRAGWAPGDVVHPWWIDLTPYLAPGKTARLTYLPTPYDFSEAPEENRPAQGDVNQANHVVRSFLVLYRAPQDSVPAPILRVTNVNGGSAAATAGIVQGDYLASYDGVRVDSIDDLSAAKKAATEAGKERVPVVVFRGSERLDLEMTSGQMGVNLSTP